MTASLRSDAVFLYAQTRYLQGIGWAAVAGPLVDELPKVQDEKTLSEPCDLVAALTALDVDEMEAEYCAEGARRGGTLLAVTAESHLAERAEDVLLLHGAVDVRTRVRLWQQQGWQRFNPALEPYTPSDLERERRWNAQESKPGKTWTPYDRDFRSHFYLTYADIDLPYESYAPAYCRGYHLASDERYKTQKWDDVETLIRCEWERHNGRAWVTVADAIRYGFLKWRAHHTYHAR